MTTTLTWTWYVTWCVQTGITPHRHTEPISRSHCSWLETVNRQSLDKIPSRPGKTGPFLNCLTCIYDDPERRPSLYIKMCSTLSEIRLMSWILSRLDILCTSPAKQRDIKNNDSLCHGHLSIFQTSASTGYDRRT